MFLSDTDTHTGEWRGFDVVIDCVFDTLTLTNYQKFESATEKMAATSGTNAITFPAGFHFEGKITSIKLVSGTVVLF